VGAKTVGAKLALRFPSPVCNKLQLAESVQGLHYFQLSAPLTSCAKLTCKVIREYAKNSRTSLDYNLNSKVLLRVLDCYRVSSSRGASRVHS
jgi:hypothetical protein